MKTTLIAAALVAAFAATPALANGKGRGGLLGNIVAPVTTSVAGIGVLNRGGVLNNTSVLSGIASGNNIANGNRVNVGIPVNLGNKSGGKKGGYQGCGCY